MALPVASWAAVVSVATVAAPPGRAAPVPAAEAAAVEAAQAGAASDLSVTPRGAKVLQDAQERLAALDRALAQAHPRVAESLDGIRAGVVE